MYLLHAIKNFVSGMMSQFLAYIRPFTSIFMREHGRSSFKMAAPSPRSMMPKHARSFQVSSSASLQSCTEEKSDHNIKELRSEDEWHRSAYKNVAKNVDLLVAKCHEKLEKLEKKKRELLEDEKKNELLDQKFKKGFVVLTARELRSIARSISQAESQLEDALDTLATPQTASALIELRTELFLRFRLAARSKLDSQLTAKILRVNKDYFAENIDHNLDRDFEYSFFLKQLKLDVLSGNLDSFLSGIGIEDSQDFLGICEFAFNGDQEAFFEIRPFGNYYIEEEVSDCVDQFPYKFNRKGILKLIGKVKMSEPMSGNCVKMVDYLSKLI